MRARGAYMYVRFPNDCPIGKVAPELCHWHSLSPFRKPFPPDSELEDTKRATLMATGLAPASVVHLSNPTHKQGKHCVSLCHDALRCRFFAFLSTSARPWRRSAYSSLVPCAGVDTYLTPETLSEYRVPFEKAQASLASFSRSTAQGAAGTASTIGNLLRLSLSPLCFVSAPFLGCRVSEECFRPPAGSQ